MADLRAASASRLDEALALHTTISTIVTSEPSHLLCLRVLLAVLQLQVHLLHVAADCELNSRSEIDSRFC